ncbi:hypothetical protein [Actinomadura rugatobispora]|uniref:Uncharacterized protein n=1 Tax=Actinomadura rugatobispora TaxID=1994 RepID=A0ABW0ZV97_9ACTN
MSAGAGITVLVAAATGLLMYVGTHHIPASVGTGVAVLVVVWLGGRS